jgi:hypothetical protein
LENYPAQVIIRFWLSGSGLQSWRKFRFGSRDVVNKLTQLLEKTRYNCTVASIDPLPTGGLAVTDAQGNVERFDYVIIATQANHAAALLKVCWAGFFFFFFLFLLFSFDFICFIGFLFQSFSVLFHFLAAHVLCFFFRLFDCRNARVQIYGSSKLQFSRNLRTRKAKSSSTKTRV